MHQQNNEDIKQISEVFHKLKDAEPIPLSIDASAAFLIVCQLQLALRYPGNNGNGSVIIRQIATVLEEALGDRVPEAVTQLEKGWHPEFDVKVGLTFGDLSINYQRALIVNNVALNMAVEALSVATGIDTERLTADLAALANQRIDNVTDEEVEAKVKEVVKIQEEIFNNET